MPASTSLMDSAKQGNRAAWAALYGASYARLFAYARLRLRDEVAARAVVAGTMRRAVREVALFHGEDVFAGAWLISLCRRSLREVESSGRRFGARTETPVQVTGDPLRDAVASLPLEHREVVELTIVAGLSEAETGMILGRSADSVMVTKAQAFNRIRSMIEVPAHAR